MFIKMYEYYQIFIGNVFKLCTNVGITLILLLTANNFAYCNN